MRVLLDTHILLWAAMWPHRLPPVGRQMIADPDNRLVFSVASLWEITIKNALRRADFMVDPGVLRRGLLDNDYEELAIEGRHALALDMLPPLHRDPFDRMLLAQAITDGMTLLTHDPIIARYPGAIRQV